MIVPRCLCHCVSMSVDLLEEEEECLTSVSKQSPASNYPKLSDESRELFRRQKFAKCRGFFVRQTVKTPSKKTHPGDRECEGLDSGGVAREVDEEGGAGCHLLLHGQVERPHSVWVHRKL